MRKPANGSAGSALFLSPEAPYPVVGGGAARTASLLEYLARRYAVDVVVFREPGASDPREAFPAGLVRSAGVIELPHHGRHALARAARNIRRAAQGCPPLIDRFSGFAEPLAEFLRGRAYDLAVLEHFWCAPYVEQLASCARKTVLNLHNIESILLERCAAAEAWPASLALRRFASACRRQERALLPRFSLLLAASESDRSAIGEICPGQRSEVLPNAIPWVERPLAAEEDVIVFSGNLAYQPNIAAVRFFRSSVWPRLRERWPRLRWRLVGKGEQAVRRFTSGDARIEVAGAVPDAIRELAPAKVVVVPLLAGSGTRVKILEAWAAGRAVVSTPLGAEGLLGHAGEHYLLARTPEEFEAAVSRLLQAPGERAELGRAGRALYEAHYTWQAAWSRLDEIGI